MLFYRLVLIVLTFSCWSVSFGIAGVGDQQYRWKAGDDFAYQVNIEVDKPTEVVTYKGVIRYHVDESSDQWSQITFRGGAGEQTRRKENARPRDPRDMMMRMPNFPDPFGRKRFTGTSATTNKITLGPRGEVLAMEGDSQLPYLIGNLSLLPFETLSDGKGNPANGEPDSWQIKGSIAVKQSDGKSRSPFPSMFARPEKSKVRTAIEETNYQLLETDEQLLRFKKTYSLKAPPIGDQAAYSIQGEGTWVLDSDRNLPHSLSFTQTLETKASNVSIRVPIKISYELLTEERLAEIDRVAAERREKFAREVAERKRLQNTPLTTAEKRTALKTLVSGSDFEVIQTLNKLALKKLEHPDTAIVSAIDKRIHDSNSSISSAAHRAMMAWSPSYSEGHKINQEYHESRSPVDSTGRKVASSRQLYVGQVVQAQERGSFWYAAEVIELLPGNRLLVKMRGGARKEVVLDVAKIQLAPDLVRQPARPARSRSKTKKEDQRWADSTGKHKIDATFIELSGDSVRLKKADGKEIEVPLERLSKKDQRRAEDLQVELEAADAAISDNPFE